jgi:hypothetical protein
VAWNCYVLQNDPAGRGMLEQQTWQTRAELMIEQIQNNL